MLTRQSLAGVQNITSEILIIKQQTRQISNEAYLNQIKPLIDNYKSLNIKTPNLLFQDELKIIDAESLFDAQNFKFKGNVVNSHVWASLFMKPNGHPYLNPQLYILANASGIKYGLDYGSKILDQSNFVQKVRTNEIIQFEIIRILNLNIGLKLYNLEKGSPLLPIIGSEIIINSNIDLINNWNNTSHLIGVIPYDEIDDNSGQLIRDNLIQLYELYKMICFDNDITEDNGEEQDEEQDELNDDKNDYKNESFIINKTQKGKLDFLYKNIIFKGVPGTGKSRLIDKIINKNLEISSCPENILRINIHSASTNSDLMRGIGITTTHKREIEYTEKIGLILNFIKEAVIHPYQPFALILEEIQENSLNELIGDLIYLIEDSKRTNIRKLINDGLQDSFANEEKLIEAAINLNSKLSYVTVPYLVSSKTKYRKMIFPDNIYVFCSSNYRNDRKIIEDNLLRRFEVIELYPQTVDRIIPNSDIGIFLEKLNNSILEEFKNIEVHPDRFMTGHAIWISVKSKNDFYAALLKVVVDFKDIKEVEWNVFKEIIKRVDKWPFDFDIKPLNNYSEMTKQLQSFAFSSFINY